MTYNCNIIFLDIDGCLTSVQNNTYFNADPTKYHPEKHIIEKVIQLCNDTKSKVLISSNWRKFDIDGVWKNSYGEYHNPISEVIASFGKYCIGAMPCVRHINKSQAIVLWFEENEFNGKFVIFDDDLKEALQSTHDYSICKHFIHVDNQFGITSKDIEKAKDILNANI